MAGRRRANEGVIWYPCRKCMDRRCNRRSSVARAAVKAFNRGELVPECGDIVLHYLDALNDN